MNSETKARFFGLIGLACIATWLTISLGTGFYLSIISLRWPKIPVRITSSAVYTGKSTLGTWFAPDVQYDYLLNRHAYHSDKIRYLMQDFYEEEGARGVLAGYVSRGQAMAAYDPQNPARSVLEPGVPARMWTRALVPLFFWGLIAYICYEIFHPHRRFLLHPNAEAVAEQ